MAVHRADLARQALVEGAEGNLGGGTDQIVGGDDVGLVPRDQTGDGTSRDAKGRERRRAGHRNRQEGGQGRDEGGGEPLHEEARQREDGQRQDQQDQEGHAAKIDPRHQRGRGERAVRIRRGGEVAAAPRLVAEGIVHQPGEGMADEERQNLHDDEAGHHHCGQGEGEQGGADQRAHEGRPCFSAASRRSMASSRWSRSSSSTEGSATAEAVPVTRSIARSDCSSWRVRVTSSRP